MGESHKQAPLHRIKSWNGSYFRPAALWEVGTYLLIQHHDEEGLCDTLQFQKKILDSQQFRKDDEEQKQLKNKRNSTNTSMEPGPDSASGPGQQAESGLGQETGSGSGQEAAQDQDRIPITDHSQTQTSTCHGMMTSLLMPHLRLA